MLSWASDFKPQWPFSVCTFSLSARLSVWLSLHGTLLTTLSSWNSFCSSFTSRFPPTSSASVGSSFQSFLSTGTPQRCVLSSPLLSLSSRAPVAMTSASLGPIPFSSWVQHFHLPYGYLPIPHIRHIKMKHHLFSERWPAWFCHYHHDSPRTQAKNLCGFSKLFPVYQVLSLSPISFPPSCFLSFSFLLLPT